MVYLFSKFSATVGMALHNLDHVLFSTNPEDQINFLKSKGLLYELSKIALAVDCQWIGKDGQHVEINLLGGVTIVIL